MFGEDHSVGFLVIERAEHNWVLHKLLWLVCLQFFDPKRVHELAMLMIIRNQSKVFMCRGPSKEHLQIRILSADKTMTILELDSPALVKCAEIDVFRNE